MSAQEAKGLAIVTGAVGGLGAEISMRLHEDGWSLLLVDRSDEVGELAARLDERGPDVSACGADLLDADGIAAVLDAAGAAGAGVSLLVNNAGILRDRRIADLETDDFAAVIEVNLVAAMRLTLALEPRFLDGACVVNISSRAALGNFGQANYVAAKSGLIGVTRALALRWAPRVRVNAVAPSLIDTPMTKAMPDRVLDKLVARIPAGRIGIPADVAGVVSFLASPDASYITGQSILVCGGRSLAA